MHPKREDMLQRRRNRHAPRPSATAATASKSFGRACARSAPTACRSKPNCAARSNATRSRSFSSRSCGSKTAPSPASKRCCAGTIRSLGRLSPAEFIHVAEETGLAIDVGVFALDRTARELAAWQQALEVDAADFRHRQYLVAPTAAPRSRRRREDHPDARQVSSRLR